MRTGCTRRLYTSFVNRSDLNAILGTNLTRRSAFANTDIIMTRRRQRLGTGRGDFCQESPMVTVCLKELQRVYRDASTYKNPRVTMLTSDELGVKQYITKPHDKFFEEKPEQIQ